MSKNNQGILFLIAIIVIFVGLTMKFCSNPKTAVEETSNYGASIGRTRQTLWRAVQMLTQKLCCQTIHDCPKVVPLHYESEWQ